MPHFSPRLMAVLSIAFATGVAGAVHHVVIADERGWSTSIVVGAGAQPQTFHLTDCTEGPLTTVQLVANGSAILRDAGRAQCDLRGSFGLLNLDFDGIAESRLTFRNGDAAVSTLVVPSLDVPLDSDHLQIRIRFITNDLQSPQNERTFLVIFGPPQAMKAYVYDGNDELIEVVNILRLDFDLQHDMLFYPLRTQLPIGTIILVPERHDGTWYGFASVGPPDGTASEVRLWEPSPSPHF